MDRQPYGIHPRSGPLHPVSFAGRDQYGASGFHAYQPAALESQLRRTTQEHHPLVSSSTEPLPLRRGMATGSDALDFEGFVAEESLEKFGGH